MLSGSEGSNAWSDPILKCIFLAQDENETSMTVQSVRVTLSIPLAGDIRARTTTCLTEIQHQY